MLDLDRRAKLNGLDSLYEWQDTEDVLILKAARERTANGGLHLHFRTDLACPSPVGWLPAGDVRADGAVVVAPGAVRQFRDLRTREPYDQAHVLKAGNLTDVPMAPDALIGAVQRNGGRFRTGGRAASYPRIRSSCDYWPDAGRLPNGQAGMTVFTDSRAGSGQSTSPTANTS